MVDATLEQGELGEVVDSIRRGKFSEADAQRLFDQGRVAPRDAL